MISNTELSKDDIKPGFREWCICEFMGHLRLIGLVTEEEHFGVRLLRVDPLDVHAGTTHTEYFGGNAIYRLTPITHAVALELINSSETVRPVTPWEYRQLQNAASETRNNLSTSPRPDEFDLDEEEEPADDDVMLWNAGNDDPYADDPTPEADDVDA